MKKFIFILSVLAALPLAFLHAENSCGDDGLVCGDNEACCEHVVAMFSEDHAVTPPYVQGQCVPKGQKCTDFWCGNTDCKSGFFGTHSVCCINTPESGGTPQYSCAYSELSCPGNTQQLSIRDNSPNRTLRRG